MPDFSRWMIRKPAMFDQTVKKEKELRDLRIETSELFFAIAKSITKKDMESEASVDKDVQEVKASVEEDLEEVKDSTSYMDDLQLSDLEIHDSNQKQSLKGDDSQTQSSISSETREEVLKQLRLSQALISSTIESMTGPFNHQYNIYYVQRSIEEVVQYSPQANSLAILQICFEEGRERELQTYLVKSNLLKHRSL